MPIQRKQIPRNLSSEQLARAKHLRRNASVVEKVAWGILRGNKLGFSFRRQHALGPYVLDFYCSEARLAIEFDGEQHNPAKDAIRDKWFAERGILTYRVPNVEALLIGDVEYKEWVYEVIALCEERAGRKAFAPPPAPSPSGMGEGV